MSERKNKSLRRSALALPGVTTLAPRVMRRVRRIYRATPRRQRAAFSVAHALSRASKEAFAAFWGRLSPVERVKFMNKAKEKA